MMKWGDSCKVVYISASVLKLAVESCDLSQAETNINIVASSANQFFLVKMVNLKKKI